MSPIRIRRLAEVDWQRFREIRLRALSQDPDAFSSTAAQAALFTEADWRARLRSRVAFVAEDRGRLIGLVSGIAAEPSAAGANADAGELISMWVQPEWRGRGIAHQLVEAVVEWARSQAYARVRLWVADGNSAAERLYVRCGFRRTGEREPLGRDARWQFAMDRPLGGRPDGPPAD